MDCIEQPPTHTEMTGTKLSPISNTASAFNALPLPKFILQLEDASEDTVNLLIEMNINKVLRDTTLATYQWLFTPETAPTHVKSITVAVKTMPIPFAAGMENDEVYIHCSDEYIKTVQAKNSAQAVFEITSNIAHAVAYHFLCRRFEDESYPVRFCRGLADYVRVKEGFLPPYPDTNTHEYLWYGWKAMPYFLDWIEKKYGEGTVCRLNAAFEAPYDKSVFEKVTGTSISSLWKMYCVSIGKEEWEHEEFNKKILALWLPPRLLCCIEGDVEDEGPDISFDLTKLLDLLANSVLAFLNYLYTPKTAPNELQEIRLVLRPGMKGSFSLHHTESVMECAASLERVKSGEVSAQDIMVYLVICLVVWYKQCALYDASWPQLEASIANFVLFKAGIIDFKQKATTGGNRDAKSPQTACFFNWIESSTGEGTIRKLYQCMMHNKYDPSVFVELTGKTVDKLLNDYKATLAEAPISKELATGLLEECL